MVKIHVSYTQEDGETVAQIADCLKGILPRHKVKKNTGAPVYKHLYFTPRNAGKQAK